MEQNGKTVSPMSNEGRNAYVVEQLTGALLALLEEKPLAEISISQLCEKAGVGRTSFYRNFQEKEDILRSYIKKLFDDWAQGAEQNPPLDRLIFILFSHFEAHRDFYTLLSKQGLVPLLKDVILSNCGFQPELEAKAAYASAFAAYSLYGWVEVWFLRGMKESAAEMAALFRGTETPGGPAS